MRYLLIAGALAAALAFVALAGAAPRGARNAPVTGHHTRPTSASGNTRAAAEARGVTVVFLRAQDEGKYELACSLLARQFYRRHHIPDVRHCVAGFRLGMAGVAVKFRILAVRARAGKAFVRCVVDGSRGTVELIRGAAGFRIAALHAG